MANENDRVNAARDIANQVKSTTNELFEKLFIPRMEKQLDINMQRWLENIIEKKIEERFAFAIELLRSMNRQAMEPTLHVEDQKVTDGKS